VPAVAVTLAVVVAFQIAMPVAVRAHLVAPVQNAVKITPTNITGIHGHPPHDGQGPIVEGFTVKAGKPGDWMLSNQTINAAATWFGSLPVWVQGCVPAPPGAQEGTTVARGRDRAGLLHPAGRRRISAAGHVPRRQPLLGAAVARVGAVRQPRGCS
jgi:hypothetical protein